MKKIFALSFLLMFIHILTNAQCRRNEIGIGVGIFQMYHGNASFSTDIKENLSRLSRVNTDAASYTKKTTSRSLPAIYYGYKINRSVKFRSSLNIYQENRTLDLPTHTIVAYPAATYEGKFTQARLSTGLSMNVSNCSCMKTYLNMDIAHYLEFAKESSSTMPRELAFIPNKNTQTTNYSVGLNPSFGISKKLCHNMSISYEAGVEVKYNTGKFNSFNFICTPLNRLSLNYSF